MLEENIDKKKGQKSYYINEAIAKRITKYAKEHGISDSNALEALVFKATSEKNDKDTKGSTTYEELNDKLGIVSKALNYLINSTQSIDTKTDKLILSSTATLNALSNALEIRKNENEGKEENNNSDNLNNDMNYNFKLQQLINLIQWNTEVLQEIIFTLEENNRTILEQTIASVKGDGILYQKELLTLLGSKVIKNIQRHVQIIKTADKKFGEKSDNSDSSFSNTETKEG